MEGDMTYSPAEISYSQFWQQDSDDGRKQRRESLGEQRLWREVVSTAMRDAVAMSKHSLKAIQWLCEPSDGRDVVFSWAGFDEAKTDKLIIFLKSYCREIIDSEIRVYNTDSVAAKTLAAKEYQIVNAQKVYDYVSGLTSEECDVREVFRRAF